MLKCRCLHCDWLGSVFNEAEFKLEDITCPRCANEGFLMPYDAEFLKPRTSEAFQWLILANVITQQLNKEESNDKTSVAKG